MEYATEAWTIDFYRNEILVAMALCQCYNTRPIAGTNLESYRSAARKRAPEISSSAALREGVALPVQLERSALSARHARVAADVTTDRDSS